MKTTKLLAAMLLLCFSCFTLNSKALTKPKAPRKSTAAKKGAKHKKPVNGAYYITFFDQYGNEYEVRGTGNTHSGTVTTFYVACFSANSGTKTKYTSGSASGSYTIDPSTGAMTLDDVIVYIYGQSTTLPVVDYSGSVSYYGIDYILLDCTGDD